MSGCRHPTSGITIGLRSESSAVEYKRGTWGSPASVEIPCSEPRGPFALTRPDQMRSARRNRKNDHGDCSKGPHRLQRIRRSFAFSNLLRRGKPKTSRVSRKNDPFIQSGATLMLRCGKTRQSYTRLWWKISEGPSPLGLVFQRRGSDRPSGLAGTGRTPPRDKNKGW